VLEFFKALPPCLTGMEACATAHYWARELAKLGHRVRLMPAKDVKAYVKRNKNDAAHAEANQFATVSPAVGGIGGMRPSAVASEMMRARSSSPESSLSLFAFGSCDSFIVRTAPGSTCAISFAIAYALRPLGRSRLFTPPRLSSGLKNRSSISE
jgi:hypothetical protein